MPQLHLLLSRALLTLAAVALTACQGTNAPVAPNTDPALSHTLNGVQLISIAPGRTLAPAGDGTLVNSKDGATITSGDAQLTVLPGSVPNGTKITMEPLNNGYIEFKFGPNGLQFSSPATLTISAAKANLPGIDRTLLKVAVASDTVDDWQVAGGTYDPDTDTVTVQIDHFSRYALCME